MAKQYTEIINGQEITITSNSGRKPPTSVFQRRYERDFPTPEIVTTVDIPNEDTIYWFMVKKGSSSILLRGEGVISESEIEELKDLP